MMNSIITECMTEAGIPNYSIKCESDVLGAFTYICKNGSGATLEKFLSVFKDINLYEGAAIYWCVEGANVATLEMLLNYHITVPDSEIYNYMKNSQHKYSVELLMYFYEKFGNTPDFQERVRAIEKTRSAKLSEFLMLKEKVLLEDLPVLSKFNVRKSFKL